MVVSLWLSMIASRCSFEMAYHAYRYEHHVTKKSRKRRYGGGRKPRLASMEDKLLFILFYFKVYPLQEVMAFLFETSQGRVNEWIHQLSTVLKMAFGGWQWSMCWRSGRWQNSCLVVRR